MLGRRRIPGDLLRSGDEIKLAPWRLWKNAKEFFFGGWSLASRSALVPTEVIHTLRDPAARFGSQTNRSDRRLSINAAARTNEEHPLEQPSNPVPRSPWHPGGLVSPLISKPSKAHEETAGLARRLECCVLTVRLIAPGWFEAFLA
jgi:hypothetical protein